MIKPEMAESENVMDVWTLLTGLIGVILPFLIELFSKSVKGKNKIMVVLVTSLVLSVVQAGTEENFGGGGWTLETILQNFIIIFGLAVNMWNMVWKQWFNEDSPFIVK
jgi:hypothetical protein